jgi:hypothetical protein
MTATATTSTDFALHTRRIHQMLLETAERARGELGLCGDPKAQALLETSAEVLLGLAKAYDDYEKQTEAVWKR